MAKEQKVPKRHNRSVALPEALNQALDPLMKKRGFASRDLISHWGAIAPEPFNTVAQPEKLVWPRGERSADGAVLHLFCVPAHRLALMHEGPNVAAAVNRYFGYLLVREVRLSTTPFTGHSAPKAQGPLEVSEAVKTHVKGAVADIADDDLRAALERLGQGVLSRKRN
jgi:hypothetical protein